MVLKDLLPLIGAIIGGLLTLGGIGLNNFIVEGREKKHFLRDKLEEIFLLSDQIVLYVGSLFAMLLAGKESEISSEFSPEKLSDALNKTMLIVKFYHPNLTIHAQCMKDKYEEFYCALVDLQTIDQVKDPVLYQEKRTILSQKLQEIKDKREDLKINAEREANKYK